jgi:hypothetical protein
MLQARPHVIHFKRILDFGEGQDISIPTWLVKQRNGVTAVQV